MFTVNRSRHNPLLSPVKDHPWEASATFNACPVQVGRKTFLVYRAMSEPDLLKEPHLSTSIIAKAESPDGFHYDNRKPLILPDREFDFFGCEDPRVTKFGGLYYIFYTAISGYPFSADNIRVAVAISKDLETIEEKHMVTPFNAKAMALFPNKINGKMAALLTVNPDRKPSDICYVEFDKPEDIWSQEFWNNWWTNLDAHKIHLRRLPDDHLELGAPPILTDKGWLFVYSHIQRYGRSDQVFGIEIALLNKDNPRMIIGRTKGPLLSAETYYEEVGHVPRVLFPSGALIRDEKLEIYYGAADTHSAMASIPLDNLLNSITGDDKVVAKRFKGNPIIAPRSGLLWESRGTFNPAAIDLADCTHIFYRAVSADGISTIGYASSSDGFSIDWRSDKPVYFPRADFENRGCEDPRAVIIGDRIYIAYTAYDGRTPRVAISSIVKEDFLNKKWSAWSVPEAITPAGIDDKDGCILPEPFKGNYMIFHRVHESVCADFVASLDFKKEKVTQCIEIIGPRRGMWDGGKVGISSPPVKTKAGWLLLYHGVSWSTTYRIGAILLDINDPTIVLARTAVPFFEPVEEYERKGIVPNVVFPCGMVVRGGMAYIYYGAADNVTGVATVKIDTLLKMLKT